MGTVTSHIDKKKQLVPPLRFKEFEGEWSKSMLKALCHKIMVGIASSATHAYVTSGIPMIRNQNIKETGLDDTELLYISEDYEKAHKNKRLKKGDIITVRTGYPGLSCIVPDKYEHAQCFTALIIRPKSEVIDHNWLVQYINSPLGRKKMLALEAGGAQKNINSGSLEKLMIPLLTLPEQQKIAAFLTAVDDKIRQLKRKKELLEQLKKGLMQKLFSQEIRFKDENGEEYPDWQWLGGDELFDNISDKKHNSDLPILAITQDQGAIPRDMIDYQMTVTEQSIASYKVVQVGDFVISLRTFQGGIEYSNYHGICSPAYIILRPSSENVDREFYKFYLKTTYYIKLL